MEPTNNEQRAAGGILANFPDPNTVYLVRAEHPQVRVSYASRFPRKVDRLKLRKSVTIFPVKVTLKADYDTNTREFDYGCSAKDTIFGGRISLNLPDQRLEYLKRVDMPNGARLAVTASCTYNNDLPGGRKLRPDFGVQLEFGGETHSPDGDASAIWVGNTFDIRQRFNVVRGLGLEVCGSVKLPQPAARYSANAGTLALGEGAFHLHVAEVNAIVRI